MSEKDFTHIPVLYDAISRHLTCSPGATVVDATIGQGGHAQLLAQRLDERGTLIGLDVDPDSLSAARKRLEGVRAAVHLIRENFGQMKQVLHDLNIHGVDVMLADIGFCSAQIEDPGRGLSFQFDDSPLDMRLDDRLTRKASWFVNRLSQQELADLIFHYGEDRQSRRIARAIVQAREARALETAGQLRDIIVKAIGFGKGGRRHAIHPATRTFQALRIAVNQELEQLENLLRQAPALLNPGGLIAVISFHSLEDRIVKTSFNQNRQSEIYEVLTRKPIIAEEGEIQVNPRSRSAKLRIAKRTEQHID